MAYLTDYHVHSRFSIDAGGSVLDFARAAHHANLAEICLTEHVDFVAGDPSTGFFSPAGYLLALSRAEQRIGSVVTIRRGIELGIEPETIDQSKQVAREAYFSRLDFVIGSVHTVGGNSLHDEYFHRRTRLGAYEDYFSSIRKAVADTGGLHLFDVIGHFDVAKRYAPPPYASGWLEEVWDLVQELLKDLVSHGIGLEINTSGLRQSPKEQFPTLRILKAYRDLGGEILTIGSDSHSPEALAGAVPALLLAREAAKAAGFVRVTTFHGRKPSFVDL